MNPYEVNEEFPFEKMVLNSPNAMQGGGAYFTKISVDSNTLFVQLPRCNTKSGIVSTKRSSYVDLTYNLQDCENIKTWLTNIENKCKDLIDEKKALWFSGSVSRNDIESMMSGVYREINSLDVLAVRCRFDTSKRTNQLRCKIYDEREQEIDSNAIEKDSVIIPLVSLEGIKFTGRSIDLEIKVVQIMVLDKEEIQENPCLIKKKQRAITAVDEPVVKIDMAALRNMEESDKESSIASGNDGIQEVNLELPESDSEEEDSEEDDDSNPDETEDNTTHTSQATTITRPEELEEITLTINELDKDTDKAKEDTTDENVKGDVTLGSLTELPDEISETSKVVEEGIREIEIEAVTGDSIKLKQPEQVYIEIYKAAKAKAKKLRQAAMEAYLEVKQIKTNYMLDNLEDSDDEDFETLKR